MLPFLGHVERLILIRDGYYHSDVRTSRRASMILAMDRGTSPTAVARIIQCNRTTVYYWLRRYLKHRDPRDLSNGHSGREEKILFRQAHNLNAIKGHKSRTENALDWTEAAKQRLRLDAKIAPNPYARRLAAILWALDRGVRITHVAHLAGISRMTIYRYWNSAKGITREKIDEKVKKQHAHSRTPTDVRLSARAE